MNKLIQTVIFLAIVAYLLKGVDVSKIDFAIFSFWGVFWTTISIVISQIVLSFRWMAMSGLNLKISLETIIVSSTLNMLLPARLGELSKAFYLKKFYGYSYHKSVSIIFIERFFDVIVLFLLMCLWVYCYFSNEIVKNSVIVLSASIFLIIIFFNSKRVLNMIKKIPVRIVKIYGQKIYKNINRLLKTPYTAFFYTILLWFFYLVSNIIFFKYSVDFNLDFKDILELFIFSTIALSVPLTPAGVGTFEGAIVVFLTKYGVDKTDALISATLYHILIFGIDLIMFYIFLVAKDIKIKDLVKK